MAHLRTTRTVVVRQCPIAEWHSPNFLKSNYYVWREPCIAPEGISQTRGAAIEPSPDRYRPFCCRAARVSNERVC
jgi:hypothetical protein